MDDPLAADGPRRWLLGGSAVLVAALLLTGCSGLVTGGTATAGSAEPAPADAGAERAMPDAPATEAKAAPQGAVTSVVPAGLDSPAVVVVGSVTLRAPDVPAATRAVTRLADRYGGRVDSQSTSAPAGAAGEDGKSVTTVRVPPGQVLAFLDDLAGIGTVTGSDISRSDVSAEVADVASRVANARASVARVRALLERATRLSDIVMLESEMSERQSDLEALEARQRVLADQTSLATVTVTVVGKGAVVAPAETDSGFLAGLRSGWAALAAATTAVLTVLGALTPFLGLVLLTAVVVLVVARRRRAPAHSRPAQP